MKQLILSLALLIGTIIFFDWSYQDQAGLAEIRDAIMVLQKHRNQNNNKEEPYLLILDNIWAKDFHRLRSNDARALLLSPVDMRKIQKRARKKFACQKDVFWLSPKEPVKDLKRIGEWKRSPGDISLPFNGLSLYRKTP